LPGDVLSNYLPGAAFAQLAASLAYKSEGPQHKLEFGIEV